MSLKISWRHRRKPKSRLHCVEVKYFVIPERNFVKIYRDGEQLGDGAGGRGDGQAGQGEGQEERHQLELGG